MSVRRVAVLTGTRADWGLLSRTVHALDADPRTDVQLIVSGTHLGPADTVREIEGEGTEIAARIPIWSVSDAAVSIAADTGAAIALYAAALEDLEPDIVLVLGDRLEAIAMALAATILSVPVAHIHGGELTEGAMDDALRHSITKLSVVHLVTTEEHRRRVIQLGEDPSMVFDIGAPIVDVVSDLDLLDRDELARLFSIRFGQTTALVTFHPAAYDRVPSRDLIDELLASLLDVDGLHAIITGSNADIDSGVVRERISRFAADNPDRVDFVESFGQRAYLSAMAASDVIVGNSSSVVLEAPVLGVPSVLVGDRQKGRPISQSVVVPEPDRSAIGAAIGAALAMPRVPSSDFGTAGFAERATEILATVALPSPPRKPFHDLKEESRG